MEISINNCRIFILIMLTFCSIQGESQIKITKHSSFVIPYDGKKLEYLPHNGSDKICDFSGAEYKGDGVVIPGKIPIKAFVKNGQGVETKRTKK